MTTPPSFIVAAAVEAARRSPCSKSKRGAVIFERSTGHIIGVGCNGQPEPFTCSGSEACRAACGKLCVHAEVRAIREAVVFWAPSRLHGTLAGLELVHAKVDDGALVAGGGPSCWQCSREVLDVQLDAVWLYEVAAPARCNRFMGDNDATCPQLTCGRWRGHDGLCDNVADDQRPPPAWRRYSAVEFHRATAAHHGLSLEARR